jgi:hypothetical protein
MKMRGVISYVRFILARVGFPWGWFGGALVLALALFSPEMLFPYSSAQTDGRITELRPEDHRTFVYEYVVAGNHYTGVENYGSLPKVAENQVVPILYNKWCPSVSSLQLPVDEPLRGIFDSVYCALAVVLGVIAWRMMKTFT